MKQYKVWRLIDNEYQVVEFNPNIDEYDNTVFQGCLSDCEAYIRLKIDDLL
jgi:hypothetical protein